MKISLSYIVKDDSELKWLERSIESVYKYVDKVFLCITNKPDEEIRKLGKKYNAEISFFAWNKSFSEARNYAFSQIPKDYDWIYWMDCDDVLMGAETLREAAELGDRMGLSQVWFNYIYQADFNPDGSMRNVVVEHMRERLVRNDGKSKWIGDLHETCMEQTDLKKGNWEKCEVLHLSDHKRIENNIARNVEILEEMLKKQEGKDPRTMYYLAKAFYDRGRFAGTKEKQLEEFKKAELLISGYLQKSGWSEERGQALEYLGEIYRELGRIDLSQKALLDAIDEYPQFPSLYSGLALNYLLLKQFDKAWYWIGQIEKMKMPQTTLVVNPRDLKMRLLEIIFHLGLETNRIQDSFNASKKMVELMPDNEKYKNRLKDIEEMISEAEAVRGALRLGQYLKKHNQGDKIYPLIQAIPANLQDNYYIAQMRKDMLPEKTWKEDEIAILIGPTFELWDETSIKGTGIGGSEEAVIHMAEELGKLGYKVTVYCEPFTTHTNGNVNWQIYSHFNTKDFFNILIVWRTPWNLDYTFKAKQLYLWLHDVPNALDFTEKRVNKLDKIFVLSDYHRKFLPTISDDKFFLTSNGMVDENPKIERIANQMVYASSYDRGLEHLLAMWPKILKEVPDATLKICYGWDTFDKLFANNPERMMWKAKMDKLMQQQGIIHLNRINHIQLAELMAQSDVWAYPTHFQEISCINAMKAQAYGSIPVTMNFAALKETVQHGIKIEGDIYDDETRDEYVKQLTDLLKDKKRKEEIRKEMMPWAKSQFRWDAVAKKWKELFK